MVLINLERLLNLRQDCFSELRVDQEKKWGTWEAAPPGFASHVIGNFNFLSTQPWWRIRSQPVIETSLYKLLRN